MADGTPLLELKNVHVRYGGIEAVRGIDLVVGEGEVVALIGGNGAGKTTTLRAISMVHQPSDGDISFRGQSLMGLLSHDVVAKGIVQVPEGRHIFPNMSVSENLTMGAFQRTKAPHKEILDDQERIYKLFPVLKERRKQAGGTLSGGEQQMLAIGRALMSRPNLLMLDEPSMGLAPQIVERVFEVIAEINSQGTPVLLIEQNAAMALQAAERGYVIETGEIVLEDEAGALLGNEQVRKAYLGEE
ncbi:MAG: branched-chain amino acid transport system ATP-binding protein [Actinomycetota bacterium]|jgi:branched-chain amino acid transport system ATP-binding protein|nr:branched-chain amino acid transport system ATP-binding protein [Actinomycetota bacterium]